MKKGAAAAANPSTSDAVPKVAFIGPGGARREYDARPGWTLLDVAREYDLEIEGACEGSMACSTCHVVVDPEWAWRLPEPSDEELDILDLAIGLEATSRLGCQITMTDELDGLTVRLPDITVSLLG